ncbi:unnamed protein product (mitochondrion) [Plasmodiophora brassicae]|uniref:Uncharacterized protein n=1 Tax=Plasmodiophora brassicae TaxID=37360 RepID=A0A3P3YAP4_PLABS|nr:unnamed protein product [Plasmodiophora brassicae]
MSEDLSSDSEDDELNGISMEAGSDGDDVDDVDDLWCSVSSRRPMQSILSSTSMSSSMPYSFNQRTSEPPSINGYRQLSYWTIQQNASERPGVSAHVHNHDQFVPSATSPSPSRQAILASPLYIPTGPSGTTITAMALSPPRDKRKRDEVEVARASPALIDAYIKASAKMKKRYLTQRYTYYINKKRVGEMLKKRFGRPRPKGTGDPNAVQFLMTIEAAYALRQLLRIERCYQDELLQPLPNRIAQVVKIRLFSMRRAWMFLNEVAFRCLTNDEHAFMVPVGICEFEFDGTKAAIEKFTCGKYSRLPGPHQPSWSDPEPKFYSLNDSGRSSDVTFTLRKGEQVFVLEDRYEHSFYGVEDHKMCYWYLVFVADDEHHGLQLRVDDDSWLPVRARVGWVPSKCIDVTHPVTMQYSLNTLKFKLESPKLRFPLSVRS